MNLPQFFERWPAKEGRLFLFGGGKDHDRLAGYFMVADHWRKKVDHMDFVRLHEPTMVEVAEACRADPLTSKFRVVAATEMAWEDPDDAEDAATRERRKSRFDSLLRVTSKMPRDLVLIMSTPHDNPLTKNPLAQSIITKGYWVVLKPVDHETARDLLEKITQWDEELLHEVVDSVGTLPADLISFVKTVRLAYQEPTPDQVRQYLSGLIRASVFELTDAIVMKDEVRAYRMASDDIPLRSLIGALDRKLTSLVQFMAELKRGRTPKEAALMLRLPGFIVHGLYEASKRWTPHEILSLYPIMAAYSLKADNPGSKELLIRDLIGS